MTKQTDYGIMLLAHIARGKAGTIFTSRGMAGATGVPLPMVSKILKLLAKNDLLTSHRGVHGGYTLTKSAEQVSLAEIIDTLEGPLSLTECTSDSHGDCSVETQCSVRGHWRVINDAVQKALSGITLSTMVQGGSPPKHLVNFTERLW